jgi:hypothetical protein
MKFWKTKEKTFPKEGIDYEFLDFDGTERVSAVKIVNGKFKDVIYHYGKVEVVEEEPPRIKFEYFIDSEGKFDIKDLQSNKKFDTLMGDILVSIFDNNVLKKEKELDESFGIIDTEKPNLQ